MLPRYAELHCRSNFTFLTGASHPEELVARAHALGYTALAITDDGSLAGVVRAHAEAKRSGLHLIVGAEMTLVPPAPAGKAVVPPPAAAPVPPPPAKAAPGGGEADGDAALCVDGDDEDDDADIPIPPPLPATPGAMRLVCLATTRRGYANLSHWITVARRRAPKGRYLAHPSDLEGRVPHAPFLAGLPDCLALLDANPADGFETLFAQAMWLKTWFGVERAALSVALLHRPQDEALAERVAQVAALTGLAVVATGDVLMHLRSRKPLQDVLTATRLGRPVASCGTGLAPNAEQHLRSRARLAALYPREWLDASVALAARCAFSLDELRYEYPQEIVPDGETPASWLRRLTEAGLARRYGPAADRAVHRPLAERAVALAGRPAESAPRVDVPPKVRAQVEHELALIAQLRYEAYFLTVADIVDWARCQGILCQGRGSAANSAVCYALGVTEVDPARMSVLFERFISAERNEPPDIDVDFEHQRREEVIQYLYRKYGRHRAALTAVVISYRPRSALRDAGRALGIDLQRIDAVSKGQHWFDGRTISPERLAENGFDPDSPVCRQWMDLTAQLIGFPRHLSQHPGGFVIAKEHIAALVPVENAAMEGRSVIQWDKDDLDALGLLKVDILALGMLSAIRRALAHVAAKRAMVFQLQDIPADCRDTFGMIQRADTVGVFQIESRAQMSMLPRLKPETFYDLVIEVAIVRPGPIQGGMVHPYLRRRSGEEPVTYPSDEISQALSRTLGVPIFQEQVMQLAVLAADFTPGEADSLRRAMAAWKRKGGLGPFHERLVGRMVAKGYEREFAESIFRQIQGFGEYGFPESHAASFALLVWASCWLKHHHPDAFLAALLDSQPMGFYQPAQLVRDARSHGVTVQPPDVRCSGWESSLEPPPVGDASGLRPVRLGLNRIGGLAEDAGRRLVAARASGGPFASVEDLARRAALDAHALQCLAQADALRGLPGGDHRHAAAWTVRGVDTRVPALLHASRTQEDAAAIAAPSQAEDTLADYRAMGLTLGAHPLALLRPRLAAFRVEPASVLAGYPNGRLARASGLVTHRQRPETAKGVVFVTLEDETGAVNVIVWPDVVEAQRRPLLASTLLTVYGQWQREGEVRHLIAKRLVDHTALLAELDPAGLPKRSRDFR